MESLCLCLGVCVECVCVWPQWLSPLPTRIHWRLSAHWVTPPQIVFEPKSWSLVSLLLSCFAFTLLPSLSTCICWHTHTCIYRRSRTQGRYVVLQLVVFNRRRWWLVWNWIWKCFVFVIHSSWLAQIQHHICRSNGTSFSPTSQTTACYRKSILFPFVKELIYSSSDFLILIAWCFYRDSLSKSACVLSVHYKQTKLSMSLSNSL